MNKLHIVCLFLNVSLSDLSFLSNLFKYPAHRYTATYLILVTIPVWSSCSLFGIKSARDLTGSWIGTVPNSAKYTDNASNPYCNYTYDILKAGIIYYAAAGYGIMGSPTVNR